MDSDGSTQIVFNTISNFNICDVETLDKFLDPEPSPTTYSQPPFQPIVSQLPNEISPSPFSHTDATPIFSPMSTNQPDAPSPMNDNQLEHELDNFITQQQNLHDITNAFTIHQLNHSASTSESSIHSVHIAPTRAHKRCSVRCFRVFK